MKILIVNKFFYNRGGDCVVAMATKRLLEERGHEVRVFAMTHPDNIPLPETKDYAPQVDFSGGFRNKLQGVARVFGDASVKRSFAKIFEEFHPDVVHLHNIHSYLSPVVGQMAKKYGARVVWTLHDYKLLCPAYLFRTPDGENCEACIRGRLHVLENKCMKGSLVQSLIGDFEARYWSHKRLMGFTDCFIAPSDFMRNKMMEGGYPPSKLVTICNFLDPEKQAVLASCCEREREDYFCYIGRLSEEKGCDTLLRAAAEAGVRLKLAGGGPLAEELKRKYSRYPGIEFLGHLDSQGVANLVSKAKASILPSEWNENNPLGIIESLSAGTPVIGANIGGIPELIEPGNGVVFTSGNTEELTRILKDFDIRSQFDHIKISKRACERFSAQRHYEALMETYAGETVPSVHIINQPTI